jgi:hypothetical protein
MVRAIIRRKRCERSVRDGVAWEADFGSHMEETVRETENTIRRSLNIAQIKSISIAPLTDQAAGWRLGEGPERAETHQVMETNKKKIQTKSI